MYYELRRGFVNGNIGNLNNQTLKLELASIQYDISAERTVKVVGKDVIKRTLGKSPDLADALCYANWAKTTMIFQIIGYPFVEGVEFQRGVIYFLQNHTPSSFMEQGF